MALQLTATSASHPPSAGDPLEEQQDKYALYYNCESQMGACVRVCVTKYVCAQDYTYKTLFFFLLFHEMPRSVKGLPVLRIFAHGCRYGFRVLSAPPSHFYGVM